MRYSEAVKSGDGRQAYGNLWQNGAQVDPDLRGMVVVGDHHMGSTILRNENGEFSNKSSVTPWYINRPYHLNPLALRDMLPIISYPDAMQTLDGERHRAVSDVFAMGTRAVAAASRQLTGERIEQMVAAMHDHFSATSEPLDIKPLVRDIRLKALQLELGLLDDMTARLGEVTDNQIRFLWGYPKPGYGEHPRLAKVVRASYDACAALMNEHISNLDDPHQPESVTRHIAAAVQEGKISKNEAIATLFGAYNAGEGTLTGTAVNVLHSLLSHATDDEPAWHELGGLDEKQVRSIASRTATDEPAVRAWQKDVAAEGVALELPDGGELHLRKGTRLLVVMDAMRHDPSVDNERVTPPTFSYGEHVCPGRAPSQLAIGALTVRLAQEFPGLSLAGHQGGIDQNNLVFAGRRSLRVTMPS